MSNSLTPPSALPMHALFHVNGKTGEKVRYPTESFPAGTKSEIDAFAQGSRIGQGRGSAYPGDWTTKSLPEEAVAAQEAPELKDAPQAKLLSADAICELAQAALTAHLASPSLPGWLPDESAEEHFTLFKYSQAIGQGEICTLRLCLTDSGRKFTIVSDVAYFADSAPGKGVTFCEVVASPERLLQISRRMQYCIREIEVFAIRDGEGDGSDENLSRWNQN